MPTFAPEPVPSPEPPLLPGASGCEAVEEIEDAEEERLRATKLPPSPTCWCCWCWCSSLGASLATTSMLARRGGPFASFSSRAGPSTSPAPPTIEEAAEGGDDEPAVAATLAAALALPAPAGAAAPPACGATEGERNERRPSTMSGITSSPARAGIDVGLPRSASRPSSSILQQSSIQKAAGSVRYTQ